MKITISLLQTPIPAHCLKKLFFAGLIIGQTLTSCETARSSVDSVTIAKAESQYDSRYFVVPFVDMNEQPGVLAIDFNKSVGDLNESAFEYKGWIGRGNDWSMFLYEQWQTKTPKGFPKQGGVSLNLEEEGEIKVEVRLPNLSINLDLVEPQTTFTAEKDRLGVIHTGHIPAQLSINGQTFQSRAVYERVIFDQKTSHSNLEEAGEARRRLDPESFFGLYDWIVLLDDQGELWQVSSGTLTEDFAYHVTRQGQLKEEKDVEVRWLSSKLDPVGKQHTPLSWQVDVPKWDARIKLTAIGEHGGHGNEKSNGTRPIYRQIGVKGKGIINGQRRIFHGMVELIQD